VTATIRHLLVRLIGWAFVLLGMAGLFLPFLQGILFLLVGLVILSGEYAWAQNLLIKLRTRFPKIGGAIEQASRKAQTWMQRLFAQQQSD